MGECFVAGSGKETIDIAFLDVVVFVVELALNGMKFAGTSGLSDEIDAGIFSRNAIFRRNVRQQPDVAVQVSVDGLVTKVSAD